VKSGGNLEEIKVLNGNAMSTTHHDVRTGKVPPFERSTETI
jgi:hypothetical protein